MNKTKTIDYENDNYSLMNSSLFNILFNYCYDFGYDFNLDFNLDYNFKFQNYKNIFEYKILNYSSKIIGYYPEILNYLSTFFIIYLSDFTLIKIFGNRARWFQLHAFINTIITFYILNEYIEIILNLEKTYKPIKNYDVFYFIINLHLFHVLTFRNLTKYDYFHHIVFVVFGILPSIFLINTNQSYMAFIPGCGIPGIIEYFILSLYKNNRISLINQKFINSINYNYFRYPLCIVGVTYNFINYNNGKLQDNFWPTIYFNTLLFVNGSLFNYLTLGSYQKISNKIKFL